MKHFFCLLHMILNMERILKEILCHLQRINPPEKAEEVWMDSLEVRNLFKIHRSTLYRWKNDKFLTSTRVGRKDMYLKSDIENLLRGK